MSGSIAENQLIFLDCEIIEILKMMENKSTDMLRVFDAHCHIYPEKIARKAALNTGAFYGLPAYGEGTPEFLLKTSLAAGIDRMLVHSVATKPEQVAVINRFIAETVQQDPEHFTGFGAMHPDSPDLKGDMEFLRENGLCGVKLHPDIQQLKVDSPSMRKIYELCIEQGLPVLVHTGDSRYDNSNPDRVASVLRDYPELKMIGAHFGGWSLPFEAAEKLHSFKNLMVDSSSTLYNHTPEETAALIRIFGADRVFFGSDYPMWSPGEELQKFLQIDLTFAEMKQILYDNAAKFLDLK